MLAGDAEARAYAVATSVAAKARIVAQDEFETTGARALLMPSFAEGFGLPVVEALQLSTPVIASNLPVFREIGDDIPLLLDPGDAGAWLAAVRALCDDGVERARQMAAMPAFRAPGWSDHFAGIEAWLRGQGL